MYTSYRVLMIEDDPDDVMILSDALKTTPDFSSDVTVVHCMKEAIAHLTQHNPDFILLDLNLPDSRGLETVRQLMSYAPHIPLVVISSLMADDELVMELLRLGAQEYLYKGDITKRSVALVMRYALERSRQRAALQASEARLRQVVEGSADGIVVVDGDGIVRFANPAAETLFERAHSELLGQPFGLPLVVGDSGADIEVRRKSGEMRFVDMRMVELAWENEPAFLATLRDVDDRRRREMELTIIAGMSAALRAAWSRTEIMEIVLDQIMLLLRIDGALFAMLDDAGNLVEGPGRQANATQSASFQQITQRVLTSGQYYNKSEAQSDSLFALQNKAEQAYAAICIPLISGETTVGALWVTRRRPFVAEDVRLLTTIADIAASAIHRATMLSETRENLHRLNILHQIDLQITAKQNLQQILAVAMQNLLTIWPIEAAAITLRIAKSARFHTIAQWSTHKDLAKESPDGVICAWIDKCVAEKHLIFLPDVTQCEPQFRREYLLNKEQARAYSVAPLTVDGEVIGVFELVWRNSTTLSPNALDFVRTLSSQMAIAVEQDRLHLKTDQLLLQTRIQAQQLQEIIDNVPAGIVLLDANYCTLLANPMGKTYLEQLTGRAYIKGERIDALAQQPFRSILRNVNASDMAVELLLPNDSWHVFAIDIKRINTLAGVGQYVLFIRDVAQQREQQTLMQQQERLASVGQMAAGIAHDFNNVLSAIMVQSHLLLSTNQLQPSSRQRVSTIVEQADHASALIRQILDFSRRSVLEQQTLDLQEVLHKSVALLEGTLPETIQLNLHVEPGAYTIEADSAALQQVILNLAMNARDAINGAGSIDFHLSSLVLNEHQKRPVYAMKDGAWLRLTVTDTGTGIPLEMQSRIFDPFFTTKAAGQGTDLGLSQVYGIIKQHNGEIVLESRPGHGSKFIIYLPMTPAQEAIRTDTPSPFEGHGETILVVEDNAALRDAVESMLENLGYRVWSAANGREALAVAQTQIEQVDLLFSDLVMPEIGGIDLYHSMKQIKPSIKAIMVSGYPIDESGHDFLKPDTVHWLQKPFSVVELAHKVRATLDG